MLITCAILTIIIDVEVTPTPKHNCDGYEFLRSTSDWWSSLGMNTRFYQWFGKNFGNGTIPEMLAGWQIPLKHIIRACTYRGSEEQVVTWPSLKYDCTSVLGCLAIVGVLAQIRGLATAVQEKMVVLLREMCSCMQATRLLLLPGVYIDVDGAGNTSLHELKRELPCKEWTSLKTRHLAKRYVLFVSSVTNDCCSAHVAQCLCFAIVFKSIVTVKNNKHTQWLVEWWGRNNVNMRTWT